MREKLFCLFMILVPALVGQSVWADDTCIAALMGKMPLVETERQASRYDNIVIVEKTLGVTLEENLASAKLVQGALERRGIESKIEQVKSTIFIEILPNQTTWQGRLAGILREFSRKLVVAIPYSGSPLTLRNLGIACSSQEIIKPVWPSWVVRELGQTLLQVRRANPEMERDYEPAASVRILPALQGPVSTQFLTTPVLESYQRVMNLTSFKAARTEIFQDWQSSWLEGIGYDADRSWMLVVEAAEIYSRAMMSEQEYLNTKHLIDREEAREELRSSLQKAILAYMHAQESLRLVKSFMEDMKKPGAATQFLVFPHANWSTGDLYLENVKNKDRVGVRSQEIVDLFGFQGGWQEHLSNWQQIFARTIENLESDLNRSRMLAEVIARTISTSPQELFR